MEVVVVVQHTVYWLQMAVSLFAIGLAFAAGYNIGKCKCENKEESKQECKCKCKCKNKPEDE